MTTPSGSDPRPVRKGGVPSRREREARRRVKARRMQRGIIVGSLIILLAAVAIIVHSLTQNNDVSAGNLHPFISKAVGGPFVAPQTIDGADCKPNEVLTQHIHQHIDVFINGKQQTIPANIGIIYDQKTQSSTCLYWVHLHDTSGIIHVEAPTGYVANLGTFLDIWSATPTWYVSHSVLNTILAKKPDVVVVNGKPYGGDIRKIPLQRHTQITLGYGNKTVTQQPTDFSAVDP
jgi:hypothetical protein